jgi:Flp pilus assembly protein CpaB
VGVNTKQVISAGGLVVPGDYVYIIFVAAVKTDLPPPLDLSHISQTILQNIEVLAVEQTLEEVVPEDTTGDGATDGQVSSERVALDRADPAPEAVTVTLAVTPDQAEILAMADVVAKSSDSDTCDIRLSLRQFGDSEQASVPAMTDFELVSLEVMQSLIRTMQQLAPALQELKSMSGQ